MMSMNDLMTISIKTPRIDSRCSLEKEFIELICMNPLMVFNKLLIMLTHVV